MVEVPEGFSFLPYPGGLLDQPHYLADAFMFFFHGERAGAIKQLAK